jgi:hypothetical protein
MNILRSAQRQRASQILLTAKLVDRDIFSVGAGFGTTTGYLRIDYMVGGEKLEKVLWVHPFKGGYGECLAEARRFRDHWEKKVVVPPPKPPTKPRRESASVEAAREDVRTAMANYGYVEDPYYSTNLRMMV